MLPITSMSREIPGGIKFGDQPVDYEEVTNGTAKTTLDPDTETAIVGKLFDRVMDHIPAQYERQGGRCAVCGRVLPTVADGLLRLAGDLECITCNLTRHDS